MGREWMNPPTESLVWYRVRVLVNTTYESNVELDIEVVCLPTDLEDYVEDAVIQEIGEDFFLEIVDGEVKYAKDAKFLENHEIF